MYIDFGGGVIKDAKDLEETIRIKLTKIQEFLDVSPRFTHDIKSWFESIIYESYKKYNQKVVVLIDEYDKPILDNIDQKEKAKEVREVLKNLYSVLKPMDNYLQLVFLTGVSKFSKVSIFSGLNQLNDITIDKEFSTICGYTQEEILSIFKDRLEDVNLEEVKKWYNGYSWLGDKVYNPFDILLYFNKKQFRPFWFETGTPTFLVKLLMEKRFYMPELENVRASDELLDSFDVDFIHPVAVLFQTGYLTIKNYEDSEEGVIYYLTYPDKEVKISFNRYLLFYFTQSEDTVINTIRFRRLHLRR